MDERKFSSERVRRILERATELEQRGDVSITEAELRAIAQEAGIDAAAITRAIREIDLEEANPRVASEGAPDDSGAAQLPFWQRVFVVGFGGMLTGAVTGFVRELVNSSGTHVETLAGFAIVAAAAAWLAVDAGGRRRQRLFQVNNALLWVGFTVGLAATVDSNLIEDAIGLGFSWTVGSALVGGLIVEYRRWGQGVRKLLDVLLPRAASPPQ